jgi:hypothetical protein
LTIPTFFGWATWVTNNIYSYQNNATMTNTFADRILELEKTDVSRSDLAQKIQKLSDKIDALPPADWRRRIEILEDITDKLTTQMFALDKSNVEAHAKLTTILENNSVILHEIKAQTTNK